MAPLLSQLRLFSDHQPHPDGAWNMAIDEALLQSATEPILRFYTWSRPELTFGFFTPLNSIAEEALPSTRRWTGGGLVEHGEDITFSLAVPRAHLLPGQRAGESYRVIHEALASALRENGLPEVHAAAAAFDAAESPTLPERGIGVDPGACFSKPVPWDVLAGSHGAKIAGGAQRRSRVGLLHQGSVRLPESMRSVDHPWTLAFAERLSESVTSLPAPHSSIHSLAARLREERYLSPSWHRRF